MAARHTPGPAGSLKCEEMLFWLHQLPSSFVFRKNSLRYFYQNHIPRHWPSVPKPTLQSLMALYLKSLLKRIKVLLDLQPEVWSMEWHFGIVFDDWTCSCSPKVCSKALKGHGKGNSQPLALLKQIWNPAYRVSHKTQALSKQHDCCSPTESFVLLVLCQS